MGGLRSVESLLSQQPGSVHRALFRLDSGNPKLYELQKKAKALHIHVQQLQGFVLDELFRNNEGVVALLHERELPSWEAIQTDLVLAAQLNQPRLVVVATSLEDPRNLGACMRSSLALGVDAFLMPSKGMCGITPAVMRTSAGAAAQLACARPPSLEAALDSLLEAGYQMVGLDAAGDVEIHQCEWPQLCIVVIGGEDRGLPPYLRKRCKKLLRIPMTATAHSYNASVALSLGLYEARRFQNFSF